MTVRATAAFPDELDLRDDDDGTYTLLAPFRYRDITVPAQFRTDFASIPRLFWPILPPDGPYGRAAVVHDWLYSTEGLDGKFTRAQCDAILLEAMAALGVGFFTRTVIYRAVRLFGQSHWDA